jgi:hypothetical protein
VDSEWLTPRRTAKSKPVPVQLTCADVVKGLSVQQIQNLIVWSRTQQSPVTHAACHAQKHSLDQALESSNPFEVLAHTDREQHSLTSDEFLMEAVSAALTGALGKAVMKWADQMCSRGALRIVFHLPASMVRLAAVKPKQAPKVHAFSHGVYGGAAAAKDAVLIIDVDTKGQLYVLTGYGTLDVPQDHLRTAGGRDCAFINGQLWLWILDPTKNEVRHEAIGGTTYYQGESYKRT